MEKPYGWFLLAKCVKNAGHRPSIDLRQLFFTRFASKNQLPGFSIIGTLAGNGFRNPADESAGFL